ncbi:MAG: GntR family transcriptional regulator [Phycisphaerae bacterium]|nr:GntR family transcriptional regulator [Phycisphaerae bacterium]
MDSTPIYQRVAESIRQEILHGDLKPGDSLPSVREMAERWNCTPGTVQHAYRELARQGIIVSQPGQGTRVMMDIPKDQGKPLRQAALVHRTEAFLLEVLSTGYTQGEVEQAMRLAMDRWRALVQTPEPVPEGVLRFAGSHDPVISLIASRFDEIAPGYTLEVAFFGSLGGLIALAEGGVELAGAHLWDAESDTYNVPFVRRLLPGRRLALVTLAHRRLGLIVRPGNPVQVSNLADLTQPALRFVNRQRGAGTRVWFDAQLRRREIAPTSITGYGSAALTHSEVAGTIADGRADVGLGIETAALAYGLSFVPLTLETYHLVVMEKAWALPPVERLVAWLNTGAARAAMADMGGYDTSETGKVEWIG